MQVEIKTFLVTNTTRNVLKLRLLNQSKFLKHYSVLRCSAKSTFGHLIQNRSAVELSSTTLQILVIKLLKFATVLQLHLLIQLLKNYYPFHVWRSQSPHMEWVVVFCNIKACSHYFANIGQLLLCNKDFGCRVSN